MGKVKIARVVLDTNVTVSALLFGGIPGRLIDLWKGNRIRPIASAEIVGEYLRVLAYRKFDLSRGEIDYLLRQEILPWFEIVEAAPGKRRVSKDPGDDKFLWCAEQGKADFLLSGDRHLLILKGFPIPILAPARFLEDEFGIVP